jgi:peptidyl-prolyl cis-trans isomerase C
MKLIKPVIVIALAACVSGVWGCGDNEKSAELANVDGKSITQSQFDAYLKFKRLPTEDERRRERLLDQYLAREALAGVIEKKNLLDSAFVQAELNEFRKEMLISRYFETYLNDTVTDQAVENYYNTHANNYEHKKLHVAHILVRTNNKMDEIERKARLTTIQEAYSKIRAGEDFASVAQAVSEDKISAKKGGDLGWLKEGSIDPRFSKEMLALKPGEVSQPFETSFGFHILKVIEGPQAVRQPFQAVAGDIRYQLRAEAKQAEMERLTSMAVVKRNQ